MLKNKQMLVLFLFLRKKLKIIFFQKKFFKDLFSCEKGRTFALAFRKGAQNEIFERLRTRRKRQGSAA